MNTPEAKNAILDKNDIRKSFLLVFKNWYWFILFIALGVGGAALFLYKSTNYYGAKARILLKPQKSALIESLEGPLSSRKSNSDEIANEIEILRSSSLHESVISKLNLDISYFIEGRIRTGEIYNWRPFTVDGKLLDNNFYGIPFYLHILSAEKYQLQVTLGGFTYDRIHKFGEPVVNDKFSLLVSNDTTIINSKSEINSEINYLFRFNDRAFLVEKYKTALQVEEDDRASVINLFIEDEVPDKAVSYLKLLTEEYISNSISVQREVNENTLAFVDNQLKDVEDILNGVESNLEQFQRERTSMNPESEQSVYLSQKMTFENERAKLTTELRQVDNVYEQLTSGSDISGISNFMMGESSDPALATAFNQLNSLNQKKTNLLFSNTPNSPIVKEVDGQISIARQGVISSVMSMRRSLVVRINALTSQLGEFQGAIQQMPSTMRGLVNINRKVEINEKMYLFLLETRAKTVIEKASIVANKVILEPSKATGHVRPIREKIIFSGFGIGLALSFLVVFLKVLFYNYVNTKEELSELTTLPIIGVIGKSKEAKNDYLIVDKFPQSLTSESYRVVRTNLSYFSTKASSKVVLFTSTVSGEGKTFNAINTATILAKAKKRVVVVDLDLHKPKQANAFNLKNDVGVTSFLVGKAGLGEIIKETPIENLSVILSGPHTPNASELVVDPLMETLVQELKKMFDYVILDTPPAGLLSDAVALMKFSDLNIYVLKAGFSKKDFVDIAHQIVEKNNIRHVSFLLNNVNLKNIPAGYGGGYYK